ncbi:MAG: type IV pilus secretin PilQ [Deltaproteobacteria bacterium]|nr:type IV pilus secretin PilQ [Deltaproteobacteria bacterium]
MRTERIARHLRNAAIAVAGVIASTPALAAGGSALTVEAINARTAGSDHQVMIETSGKPTFSVFRLADPFRVLVDVSNASLAKPVPLLPVNDGVIRYVEAKTLDNEQTKILRIEIGLVDGATYEAALKSSGILVSARAPSSGAAPSVAPAAIPPQTRANQPARLGRLQKRGKKGRTLLEAKLLKGEIPADAVHIEQLSNPTRLVVDLDNVEASPKWQRLKVGARGIRRARLAAHGRGLRVVLDGLANRPLPAVEVAAAEGALQIWLKDAPRASAHAEREQASVPASATAAMTTPAPATASPAPHTPATATAAHLPASASAPESSAKPTPAPSVNVAPSENPNRVVDVRFEPKDGFVRLTVELERPSTDVKKNTAEPNSPAIRLPGVMIPKALERALDVSSVAHDVVSLISTYKEGRDTIVTAQISPETEHRQWQKGNRIMWDFRGKPGSAEVIEYPEERTSGYAAHAASAATRATTLAPRKERYQGRRISLDLKDAEILNVLRLLADVSKLNIVAGDDVKGRVTIKLRNVPWDQALDIILRSRQLDKTRQGNIVRVAPIEVLRKEEELRIERMKARIELEPLTVRLIPVSYAVAKEIQPQVKALLSPRGKVNIDKRTNVLVVEDIADVLLKVERLVRTLDTQTPQVLIEARIVEARSSFSRDLGIQWGGSVSMTPQFGTSTGLAFPNSIRIGGGASGGATPTDAVMSTPGFAVNLPAAAGVGSGGAIGFILGSAGGSTLLNLRLSAAEEVGKVKIISAPKIVTIDNKEAKILSGEKIPITVVTANGPSTRFINANIELTVTPHVTQDGSILMKIAATKNELSDRTDLLGVPGIITKEADTEMIVRDGDTAVLGGLYRRTATDNKSYVPWFGKIPVLGWIFKKTSRSDARDELLIFISPRIVNRSQALVVTD